MAQKALRCCGKNTVGEDALKEALVRIFANRSKGISWTKIIGPLARRAEVDWWVQINTMRPTMPLATTGTAAHRSMQMCNLLQLGVRCVEQPVTHNASNHASYLVDGDARTTQYLYIQAKIMLVNQHEACQRTSIHKEVEKFQFFAANDARWVNLQCLYTLAKVLRVFYQKTDCLNFRLLVFIKLALFILHSVESAY